MNTSDTVWYNEANYDIAVKVKTSSGFRTFLLPARAMSSIPSEHDVAVNAEAASAGFILRVGHHVRFKQDHVLPCYAPAMESRKDIYESDGGKTVPAGLVARIIGLHAKSVSVCLGVSMFNIVAEVYPEILGAPFGVGDRVRLKRNRPAWLDEPDGGSVATIIEYPLIGKKLWPYDSYGVLFDSPPHTDGITRRLPTHAFEGELVK